MNNIQTIENVADCVSFYLPHSLYLKPLAKMQISVALPTIKSGKSISNLEIMDKLSAELKPDKFLVLKVSKNTVNCIRFEAELDERKHLRQAIERLDGCNLRLSSFNELLRVRCTEAKDDFPTRHDWDSYFRDARNMDEMKAGERPDTIYLTHLPIRWFCPRHSEHEENVKPSENIFKRIFEKFGTVRAVDIPICDPYRKNMSAEVTGMRTFSFEQDVLFEAYVQFEDYSSFVRAMDELRGTKLVRKFVDKTQAINICVTFDKEKHLSDSLVQRRERYRKRLVAKALEEEEEIKRQKLEKEQELNRERQKQEQAKLAELEKQREREEKRKAKHLKKIQERGQVEISQKIRIEERKLMIAQRKLESIRILEQVFERIQIKQSKKDSERRKQSTHKAKDLQRERLVEKYKTATEKLVCDQRKIVADIKNKTPLMGLLKNKSKKHAETSSDDENASSRRQIKNGATAATTAHQSTTMANQSNSAVPAVSAAAAAAALNPFKAVAALAAGAVPAAAAAYSAEAANEWMQSLSMFGYGMPGVFPGALYRAPPPYAVSGSYRGFAPRSRGGRSRGRGIRGGRGGYDGHSSSSYYNPKRYDDDRYDDDDGNDGYYHKSRGRNRSRSSSSSRSRSRSRGRRRSHSRSRSRSHYRRSSYSSRSRRSHSHSRSRSKTPSQRNKKKLVSTLRSRSTSYSRSRSRSRTRSHTTHRSKRSKSRRDGGGGSRRSRSRSRSHQRSRSRSNDSSRRVVLETDKLVRSAEQIQRTIEQHTKDRMREEEREIRQSFRNTANTKFANNHNHSHNDVHVDGDDDNEKLKMPDQQDIDLNVKSSIDEQVTNGEQQMERRSSRNSRRNSFESEDR